MTEIATSVVETQISAKGGQQSHPKFREFFGGYYLVYSSTQSVHTVCAAHCIDIAIYIVSDL